MYAGFKCKNAGGRKGGDFIATTPFMGVLVVLVAVAVAVAGLAAMQRLVPLPIREEHNAATGIIYAALYVMFGVTVAFTFLFGIKIPWLHMLAVAALTAIITLIIYTIAVLDYPYNGDLRVGSDAFEQVLREIEGD